MSRCRYVVAVSGEVLAVTIEGLAQLFLEHREPGCRTVIEGVWRYNLATLQLEELSSSTLSDAAGFELRLYDARDRFVAGTRVTEGSARSMLLHEV